MAVPIDSHPEVETIMTYPRIPTMYKEHVVIKIAREFGVMPACDVRTPGPNETVLDARDGEITFFRDALKAGLRWPLHPFFLDFLTSYMICPGQLAPNGWRLLVYFFILCRCLGVEPRTDLLRMVYDLKYSPGFNCFVYLSAKGGFRTPDTPSSLRGWKERYFFASPQNPDHPFRPMWSVPDKDRFNEGQPYVEVLERDRLKLVNREPLAAKVDFLLEDDTLELANVRGIEGMSRTLTDFAIYPNSDRANDLSFLQNLRCLSTPQHFLPTCTRKPKAPRPNHRPRLRGRKELGT
jgi:hypothetical protein